MTSEKDDALQAKIELLERLGQSRAALSQAFGWLQALHQEDLRGWGVDLKPEVAVQLERMITEIDRIIDGIQGDRMAEAEILYASEWPKLMKLLGMAQKIFGLGKPL